MECQKSGYNQTDCLSICAAVKVDRSDWYKGVRPNDCKKQECRGLCKVLTRGGGCTD